MTDRCLLIDRPSRAEAIRRPNAQPQIEASAADNSSNHDNNDDDYNDNVHFVTWQAESTMNWNELG